MSLIVAARFTTFPAAEAAAQQLFERGFVGEDVNLFFVNPRGQHARHPHAGVEWHDPASAAHSAAPPGAVLHHHRMALGAVVGAIVGVALFMGFRAALPIVALAAGVGAYLGARIGATLLAQRARHVHHERVLHEMRNSGVLVAVHVGETNALDAASVLSEAGGVDLERARGQWQRGHWADFDPTAAPTPFAGWREQHT